MTAAADDVEATGDPLDGMDPETSRHPQGLYALLRESAPALRKEGAGVIVSRMVDVDRVLHQPELFSSGMGAARLGNVRPLIPLQIDPPEHRRFRRLLDPLFSPAKVRALEEPLAELVHTLIDGFGDAAEVDLVPAFTLPFPSQVFLTMLGCPLEELPKLLELKDGIIRPHVALGTTVRDPAAEALRESTGQRIYTYFDTILDARAPGDADLLSRFLEAQVDGERLSRNDILDICFLFLIAGLDTVSGSLDCIFRFLAEHPEQRARLVDDATLIPDVVEELLRWESPVMIVSRVATADTELAGCPISAGETVLAVVGSANTEGEGLGEPDLVSWDRQPRRHLAFGGGVHRCLGSHLARLELTVALREWHARIPHYSIKPGADLTYSAGVRSLSSFPVVLHQSL